MTALYSRTFSGNDLERIRAEADRRIENHPGTWSVDMNRIANERLGVAAEWAVSNWLGVSESAVFEDHGAGGDKGVDVWISDGRPVTVKATLRRNGRLIIPPYQEFLTGFAVLCIGVIPAPS